ncbi:hypothetical protein F5Y19DRAFT_187243 [Xylariaceae sp. FL1651]|nr:hypothetical protein F5Y19DRAFT_187243 [Xylariaceae sp. FL1651]
MIERPVSCKVEAEAKARFLSAMQALGRIKPLEEPNLELSPTSTTSAPSTHGLAKYNAEEFFKGVGKAVQEWEVLRNVLLTATDGLMRPWLTPEGEKAKNSQSRRWNILKEQLHKGPIMTLKEAFPTEDRTMVLKGFANESLGAPVVGILLALKMRKTDIENLEAEIPSLAQDAEEISKKGKVSEEELPPEDAYNYRYKLQYWGINWDFMFAQQLAVDNAKVKHMREYETFWMIEVMGVVPGERGKGVGRKMIEEVKDRSKTEKLPVLVWADRSAIKFYERCGFHNVGSFTYCGRKGEDAIMRWVWDETNKRDR